MTLDTLIEFLTDYRDEFGGDAEVRLMTQQNWPFENRICGVTSGRDMNEADDEDEDEDGRCIFFPKDIPKRVALVVGAIVARRSISSVAPCCWTRLTSS